MNKKGFTLIEVLVAFVLTSIVLAMLLSVASIIKQTNLSKSIKLDLVAKQGIISEKINNDFNNQNILSITRCDGVCYMINYTNGTSRELKVNRSGSYIKYGNYATNLPKGSKLGDIVFRKDENINGKSLISLGIRFDHALIKDDYLNLEAFYIYDANEVISIEGL